MDTNSTVSESLSSSRRLRDRRRSWPPSIAAESASGIFRGEAESAKQPAKGGTITPAPPLVRRAQSSTAVLKKQKQGSLSSGTVEASVLPNAVQRKRRIASIFQHYYPEGNWGYVVLVVGFLVQLLSHGLQLSFGVLAMGLPKRWCCHGPRTSLWRQEYAENIGKD